MKKLWIIALLGWASVATAQMTYFDPTHQIDDEHIYFFTQNMCPHCNHAATYIAQAYPDIKVRFEEISSPEGREHFLACVNKFQIKKRYLGTPLICMGQHYILGWTEDEKKQFDEYVKDFIEKQ